MLFGYKINIFQEHKNLVYATNMRKSQIVMSWWLTTRYFGTTIQSLAGVDNIGYDTLSISISAQKYQDKPKTRNYQCLANNLFATSVEQKFVDVSPLVLSGAVTPYCHKVV